MDKLIPRYSSILMLIVAGALLTSCGGGGSSGDSGGSSDQFSLSTNAISFFAATPMTRVDSQTVTGVANGDLSGTLYILATVSGNAVASVSNFTINTATNSGTADINPVTASALGEGSHAATITVRACLNDITCATGELSGSPQTIDVSYDVAPSVAEETVMPHVVRSGTPGEVVVRGYNFVTDNINNVRFNGTNATSINVVSETEIRANYSSLTAGNYTVALDNTSGPTAFSGNLVVIDAPAFIAGTQAYSTPTPQVLKLVYDAEREALLVAASYFNGLNVNTAARQTNEILRYQFSNGAFVSMTTATIPLLQGMDLSPDGSELIAVADREVLHLNPATLAEITSTAVDAGVPSSQYLKDVVVMNDGQALITTGWAGSGSTPVYIYPVAQPGLAETTHPLTYNGSLAGSANGSYAVFVQGFLSPAQPVSDYTAVTGLLSESTIDANQVQCINSFMGNCVYPAVDPAGQRFAVIDNTPTVNIYDRSFALLGKLPITSSTIAFSIDGTSLFALDGNTLREYDLTAMTDINNNFPEVGAGTAIASPGSTPVRMILSDDGGTLFIAGRNQIVIQPAP